MPTPRRVLLFLIFLFFTLSGIMAALPPFQQLFGLPYMLAPETYAALAAQIIYSYILACIYAFGYVWLEASIRRRYPHMNDIVKKRQSVPVQEPLAAPGHPPASMPVPHARIHARKKKTAKKPGKR